LQVKKLVARWLGHDGLKEKQPNHETTRKHSSKRLQASLKTVGVALGQLRGCSNMAKCASLTAEQEAQLSQRDRATLRVTEYFAKSFEMTLLRKACVSPY